ncbi:MAG: rod shape-determining protein MreD [Deltaproteobacteria bacterium]|nr:rod shape-determining protein MreD [Deltaproteobacteria bacterium]
MRRLFAVPVGALALALVTALQATEALHRVRVDPCAILVVYLAFRADVLGAAVSTLLLGALMDVAAGSTLGLHMFSLTLLFVGARIGANAFPWQPGVRLWPLGVGGAFAHAVLVAALVRVFAEHEFSLAALWTAALPSLAADALVSPLLLALADALARRVDPEPDHMFLPR